MLFCKLQGWLQGAKDVKASGGVDGCDYMNFGMPQFREVGYADFVT